MEAATIRRLADLNRAFYEDHGENFADARPRLAAGIRRVLQRVEPGAAVLEVGCGDGMAGRWLARRGISAYVGLDSSAAMIARAERLTKDWKLEVGGTPPPSTFQLSFLSTDLLDPNWPTVLSDQSFHRVLAFAVFHHLPGAETRARVLQTLAGRLRPGGWLAMSNWQLTRSERLRRRSVPWSTAGLSEADVEPNDCLLTWERKGRHGLRYVHVLDEAEARGLAAQAGLSVVEVFQADGVTGDLADYVVMHKPA